MIALERVSARAGRFELRDVSLAIPRGAWAVLLGPAGAGKTTLLDVIAGVRDASQGRVLLRDEDVTHRPPELRRVGMVYQHAFLFPHLSVRDNVMYGATPSQADAIIGLLAIESLLDRSVRALSGGERQLVALARALAAEPDILLLDEPFAALDPRRRTRVRGELRRLQRERGTTVIQVTHDFVEAGLLGDLAIVLEEGAVQQVAAPDRLFRAPASASIADFIGIENVFHGIVAPVAEASGADVESLVFRGEGVELFAVGPRLAGPGHAVVRAEDVTLAVDGGATSARNALAGTVTEVALDGVLARVSIRVGEASLVALVTRAASEELGLAPGRAVTATIKATNVHLC